MSKFCYEEGELEIADCQCDFCMFYNDGKRNEICPTDILEKIESNEVLCPNMKGQSFFDLDRNDK